MKENQAPMKKKLVVALAGNPNSGKTSIFNQMCIRDRVYSGRRSRTSERGFASVAAKSQNKLSIPWKNLFRLSLTSDF